PNDVTLRAFPGTDIWRKPPTTNAFNAPTHPVSKPLPLTSFKSARITISASWTTQYDQGGLLLELLPVSEASSAPISESQNSKGSQHKWLKTGVEYYNGHPRISTVGCDGWADWSIYPVPKSSLEEITMEVRRDKDINGKGLWVYFVEKEEKVPVREVCWFFAEEEEMVLRISGMAARPAKK
ncbi:hypothetical protein K402DRAFT_316017, partial [Aulographum hederae CBS 113979]